MTLPKVLVIDDQFGRLIDSRRNLCISFGLVDITGGDPTPEEIRKPVAEAVFCSSQRIVKDYITNDIGIALDAVRNGWPWALVLLDIRFGSGKIGKDGDPEGLPGDMEYGLGILESIKKHFPEMPVVMLSAREREEIIEECRRKGAEDFIQRVSAAGDEKSPRENLSEKLFQHGLLPDTRVLKDDKKKIVGTSLPILLALRLARRAATGKGNTLLLGETGTGKELLAQYIHDLSTNADGPFVGYHPGGRAETLQEDELFGHVKGAFTGANADREGVFERAKGGTLFIDEVGDISEGIQLNLLRPLESRIISRQGGNKDIQLDLQVVLATNKNLEEYAGTGKFKSDLLNRINAYPITIPPLRDRKGDIPLIAERLLELLCKEHGVRWPRRIVPEAMDLLRMHEWPDNVRELRNVLERAVLNNKDSELVVPTDLMLETGQSYVNGTAADTIKPSQQPPAVSGPIHEIIESLETFEFPKNYAELAGKLPLLQEAFARLLTNYLQATLSETRKKTPDNIEGELNLTAAGSCMMGKQLKPSKAADVIKKLLHADKIVLEGILKDNPLLQTVYNDILRLRPTNPKKIEKDNGK